MLIASFKLIVMLMRTYVNVPSYQTPHIEPGESLGQSVSAADIQSIAGSRSGNPKVLQAVRALLSQPVVDASNGLYALPAIPNAVDAAGRRGSASVRRNRTDQPHVSFPSSFSNAFTTPWLRCKLATVQHRYVGLSCACGPRGVVDN